MNIFCFLTYFCLIFYQTLFIINVTSTTIASVTTQTTKNIASTSPGNVHSTSLKFGSTSTAKTATTSTLNSKTVTTSTVTSGTVKSNTVTSGTTTSIPVPTTTTTPKSGCLNGGLNINNSKCLCQGLFEGTKCEILKCVSGGYIDLITNRCKCPKGYIGLHCEGFIRHPKPENIFESTQSSLNIYIFKDSTAYYGKLGLNTFKEVLINHATNNENNYQYFLVSSDYSGNNYSSSKFSHLNNFVNYVNTTILPERPTSYACYTVNMYKNIIEMIKKNQIENSPFVIYTQHPPSDYEIYKDELEELAIAFKIRFTILFQNDLLLDGCDETDNTIQSSFSALRDLAFLSGGIFYQLESDKPQLVSLTFLF